MAIVEQSKSAAKCSRVPPWKQKDLPQVTIVAGTTNDGRRYSDVSSVVSTSSSADTVCALMIPNMLLCKWHYEHEAQLISSLNAAIIGNSVAIRESCERLNRRLQQLCREVSSKYSSSLGRKKQAILDSCSKVFVLRGETVSLSEYSDLLEGYATVVLKCDGLEQEIDSLYAAMRERAPHSHLESITVLQNKGRPIHELSPRQAKRKLKQFKSNVENVLWFAESFGMKPTALRSEQVPSKLPFTVKLFDGPTPNYPAAHVPEEDRIILMQVLYLMDRFSISDECYHELSMLCSQLPRSHKVKSLRKTVNKSLETTFLRVPHPYQGVYCSFRTKLQEEINVVEELDPDVLKGGKEVRIKISGDGTQLCRNSNFLIISFCLLNLPKSVLSPKANRIIAIVKIPENYNLFTKTLSAVFDEINEVVATKTVTVCDKHYSCRVYIGGDLKFLLMVFGLAQASSKYSCVWCLISSKDRWDTSIRAKKRTIEDIMSCSSSSLLSSKPCQNYGVKERPLFKIDLDDVIADELHLLLRVMDVMLNNIINQAIAKDISETHCKNHLSGPSLQTLISCVRECGVSFHVWEKRNSEALEWTSLRGLEVKKVLSHLPLNFHRFLPSNCSQKVVKLWKDFEDIYSLIGSLAPNPNIVSKKACEWIATFLSLSTFADGYQKENITPYMHIMAIHIPEMITIHGNLKQFSCQSIEKLNDDSKKSFFSCNKWDPTKDVLLTQERLNMTTKVSRKRRNYTKHDDSYWSSLRRKRPCLSIS